MSEGGCSLIESLRLGKTSSKSLLLNHDVEFWDYKPEREKEDLVYLYTEPSRDFSG